MALECTFSSFLLQITFLIEIYFCDKKELKKLYLKKKRKLIKRGKALDLCKIFNYFQNKLTIEQSRM